MGVFPIYFRAGWAQKVPIPLSAMALHGQAANARGAALNLCLKMGHQPPAIPIRNMINYPETSSGIPHLAWIPLPFRLPDIKNRGDTLTRFSPHPNRLANPSNGTPKMMTFCILGLIENGVPANLIKFDGLSMFVLCFPSRFSSLLYTHCWTNQGFCQAQPSCAAVAQS